MKKSRVLFLFVASFIAKAYSQDNLQQKIDSLASLYIKNTSGALVIGIVEGGEKHVFYYGETEKGNKKLPNDKSVFELGELSETFTCILYADMTLKGIINSDEKLKNFLPMDVPAPIYQDIICKPVDERKHNQFHHNTHPSVNFTPYVCFPDPSSKPQEIILCDLGTHTTGLPQYPYNYKTKNKKNYSAEYTKENLYDFLKNFTFKKPIGYDYKHSATGITLLGHALSLKLKMDFDSLITIRIFTPLGMNNTRVNLSIEQQQNFLSGHDEKGKISKHWHNNILAPAIGIHSTISDMMQFLSMNIAIQKDYYNNLLDYTHNGRIKLTGKKNKDNEIALGWRINPIDNKKRVVWQSGLTSGFASYIGILETNHTGVVILSSIAKDAQQMGEQIITALSQTKL